MGILHLYSLGKVCEMLKNSLSIALLALLVLTVACGYRFQGSGSILPKDINTVAIGLVDNETTIPGLGLELTEALRSEFER